MDELISRQVLDLWNRYKPTIAVDAMEYDRELKKLLSTNLAEVGTDLATKRAVKGFPIDADLLMLKVEEEYGFRARDRLYEIIRYMPKYELPSAQPEREWSELDKQLIDTLLRKIYESQGTSLSMDGVVAKKYYVNELYKVLFGRGGETEMDDLISRQAAVDALGEEPPVWYDGEDEIAEQNQWKRDIEAIKQLPPIQPKRGKWIHVSEEMWKCDQCGEISCCSPNFCPDCGSRNEVTT